MLPVALSAHRHHATHDKTVSTADRDRGFAGDIALNTDTLLSGSGGNTGDVGIIRSDLIQRCGISRGQHGENIYITADADLIGFVDGSALRHGRVGHGQGAGGGEAVLSGASDDGGAGGHAGNGAGLVVFGDRDLRNACVSGRPGPFGERVYRRDGRPDRLRGTHRERGFGEWKRLPVQYPGWLW